MSFCKEDLRTQPSESSQASLLPRKISSCYHDDLVQCNNKKYIDELFKANVRLKVYFGVLAATNILLIVILCVFFLSFHSRLPQKETATEGSEEYRRKVTSESKPSTSCPFVINCALLKYRLNATSFDGRQQCTLDDFLNAVTRYFIQSEFKDVIHLVGGIPEERKNDNLDHTLANWTLDNNSKSTVRYLSSDSSIIIPSDGYYFIYSKVSFSLGSNSTVMKSSRRRQSSIKHAVRIKHMHQGYEKFMTISIQRKQLTLDRNSYLQRVAKLKRNDELKVTISYAGFLHFDAENFSDNYFGVFKI